MMRQDELTQQSIDSVNKYATELERLTGIRDNDIRIIQSTLRSYGVESNQINRSTEAVIDLFTQRKKLQGANITLATTAELVAKSYAGVTQQLRRHGIVIRENINNVDKFEAVLSNIERRMGGVGAAFAETMGGMTDRLSNLIDHQKRIIGPYFIALAGIAGITAVAVELVITSLIRSGSALIDVNSKLTKDMDRLAETGFQMIEIFWQMVKGGKTLDDVLGNIGNTMRDDVRPSTIELAEQIAKISSSSDERRLKKLSDLLKRMHVDMTNLTDVFDKPRIARFGIGAQSKEVARLTKEFEKLGLSLSDVRKKLLLGVSEIALKNREVLVKNHLKAIESLSDIDKQYLSSVRDVNSQILDLSSERLRLQALSSEIAIRKIVGNEVFKAQAIGAINNKLKSDLERLQNDFLIIHGTGLERIKALYSNSAKAITDLYTDALKKLPMDTAMMFVDRFSDMTSSVIDGSKKAGEAFKDFATGLLNDMNRIMSQLLAKRIVSSIFGIGLGMGAGLTPTAGTAMSGGFNVMQSNMFLSALGGILPGSFKSFANGGIMNRPTFGIIAEAGRNEAAVPLPDGKRIPLDMPEQQPSVTLVMNIEAMDAESFALFSEKHQEQFVAPILENLQRGGSLRKALGRYVG
jgi:hypothetical protein